MRQDFVAVGQNNVPVLADSLDIGPESGPCCWAGARVLGSVLTLGFRTPKVSRPGVAHLDLAGMGTLMSRALADQMHQMGLGATWDAALPGMVSQPGRSAPESRTQERRPQPSRRPG